MTLGDLRYSAPQGFVAEPLHIKFEGVEDLEEYLEAARATRPLLIRRPEDVLLSLDGLVQQRYQLTPWGLWSLCRRLSPNLGSVISDLIGLGSNKVGKRKIRIKPDTRSAAAIINTMIRSRFSQVLEGAKLIVDPVRGTIDGVVGARYAYLSNTQLYESSSSFVKSMGGIFLSAALLSRRILLRYAKPDPSFEANGMSYSIGWGFSNSETGQSAAKGGLLLVDRFGCSSMRPVFRKTHTKSLEEYFDEWLQQKMYEASSTFSAERARKHLERLAKAPVPCDLKLAKDRADNLFTKLHKLIPRSVARKVAQEVFNPSSVYVDSGSWRAPTSPIPAADQKMQYILYELLTNLAENCFPADREAVECLAYDFLAGGFNPF